MGHRHSSHPGEPPAKVLEVKDLPSVANYMSSKKCENVFLMVGAGISTAAGIPDFRSPETGLYANLARLNLPYPEAVFEIDYFRRNPLPFYTLAQELYPGQFRPTITHSFIRLLHSRSILHTCFTQNIDTLERRAGIPAHKIVEAHGSFASNKCIDCSAVYDNDTMKQKIRDRKIPRCADCGGLVKPDIVFFGEQMPPRFLRCATTLCEADLLICIGTSLTVFPFASLLSMIPRDCPRVLINLDLVGDFGTKVNDVVCLGKCDDIVQSLCKELGWEEELMKAWEETKDSVEAVDKKAQGMSTARDNKEEGNPKRAADELEALASKMEKSLALHGAVASTAALSKGKGVSPSTGTHTLPRQPDADGPPESEASPTKGKQTDIQAEADESEAPAEPPAEKL
jgi:NAD-dependent histone deacetylase SIR2